MIFVTVGTHEQQFDRLVSSIDEMKRSGMIGEEVFIQTGYCNYQPVYCGWKKMLSYEEVEHYMQSADIIITHGGPASFMSVLQHDKIPIVVPRQKRFGEHVNDHQMEFVESVHRRYGNIIPVYDIHKLGEEILYYERESKYMGQKLLSNNKNFINRFSEIVREIVPERRAV